MDERRKRDIHVEGGKGSILCTVDSELSRFAESSTGNVVSDTRVVASITESHLTDDKITFIRDNQIDVIISLNWVLVF